LPRSQRIGRAQHHGVRSIGQVYEDDRRTGHVVRHVLERRSQHEQWMSDATLPDGRRQVVGQHALGQPELAGQPDHGAPVHAGDDDAADITDLEAGRLQRPAERVLPQGQVAVLAEALLPEFGHPVTRGPPTVGELVRCRGGRHELGHHVGPVTHQHGGAGVAAARLVATRRQAVAQVGGHDQRGLATFERGQQAPDARAQRATEVVGADVARQAQRRGHGRRVRLVEIGRPCGGEPERIRHASGGRTDGQTRRFDTQCRGVLVVGRHGSAALATTAPHEVRDVRPGQAPVGHVTGRTHNPSHDGQA
jgi:hypothetical protein